MVEVAGLQPLAQLYVITVAWVVPVEAYLRGVYALIPFPLSESDDQLVSDELS